MQVYVCKNSNEININVYIISLYINEININVYIISLYISVVRGNGGWVYVWWGWNGGGKRGWVGREGTYIRRTECQYLQIRITISIFNLSLIYEKKYLDCECNRCKIVIVLSGIYSECPDIERKGKTSKKYHT